jgi:hypothetical protein
MKKLFGIYKNLPREMKMLIAMAGLGTPIGVIYCLRRFLGLSTGAIIFLAVILVGLLALVSLVIPKLFGRSARKRAKKMEAELASGAEGAPVSMDLRAAIKSNNEKFFAAIKDMRRLGIRVYDLPWYIVIGDSGCGKTKLINEGGLTFSTGKPEGYQLGTLNYNWWFTEDAIFIDMAGRLCNPQEDADRREWEAFLRTIAGGRRGYPINGVLACVSAEHLLAESPEQHEADANTLLERLRDLQNKLGVTFATYLVVTKCDKIVGFMQFFDRAERDITIKNQVFGWSRPGDFNELYDPEQFGADFDHLYGRLNELRLRRLNDDVDEFELGLAYSFPEEYRQLKEPLQTYVRTLFPMIKSPRAVKNLIFRGVYFTSATQQGTLILRHLAERLGADVASQFPPLESMYPRPRPHFVKDLLFRKVFPEQGLVFRNEQEVIRNRKLARLLTVGTAVLGVALVVTLILSSVMFGRLISQPRQRAQQAPVLVSKTAEAVDLVGRLGGDTRTLRASVWPTVLSLGVGADRPADDLTNIRMRLFVHSALRARLTSVDEALQKSDILPDNADPAAGAKLGPYLESLTEYLVWYGCSGQTTTPKQLDYESFSRLSAVLADRPLPPDQAARRALVDQQASEYFATIHSGGEWENPAALLAKGGFQPSATVLPAITKLHNFLAKHYATLNDRHPNPTIREWVRIRDRCAAIAAAYQELLAAAGREVATQEDLDSFRQAFSENYTRLTEAMAECRWQAGDPGSFVHIPTLREALWQQREQFLGWQQELRAAYTACQVSQSPADPAVLPAIDALIQGDGRSLAGLDRVLAESLFAADLSDRGYFPEFFKGEVFNDLVREVDQAFSHIIVLKRAESAAASDRLDLTDDLQRTVHPVLTKVHEQLATLATGQAAALTPEAWIQTLTRLLFAERAADRTTGPEFAKLSDRWQPAQLQRLNDTYQELVRKAEGTVLLRAMEDRLGQLGSWGFAELAPDWREARASAYYIPGPAAPLTPAAPAEPVTAPPPVQQRPTGPPPVRTGAQPPAAGAPTPPPPPPPAREREPGRQVPGCATPEFLNLRAAECFQLLRFLTDFETGFYLSQAGDPAPRNRRCAEQIQSAWQRYCESYVGAWNDAYAGAELLELTKIGRWEEGWEPLATQFQVGGGVRGGNAPIVTRKELEPALAEVLRATRWATYEPKGGWWLDQQDAYYATQARRVADVLAAAFRDHWSQGAFVRDAAAPPGGAATGAPPWEALAAEVGRRWGDWCEVVGRTAKLPRRFDTISDLPKLPSVPWDGVVTLRVETGLRDERLTQQLVDFQKKAQAILSAELTNILYSIQATSSFGDAAPFDGWPYLDSAGTGLAALEVVPFDQFTRFLTLVQRAQSALEPLEQGLPDDDLRRARRGFVSACDQWRSFIGLTAQGGTSPLEVTVWTEDPVGEPYGKQRVDDSAQHYYKQVRLSIALRLQETGDLAAVRPLEFQTTERGRARSLRAVWEWSRVPEQYEFTFELVDGIQPEHQDFHYPPIKPLLLGKPSPLAFCAYLHRYGLYADGNWVVSHGLDLAEKFREAGKSELVSQIPGGKRVIGEKFIFQLPSGRKLPDPIPKLNPAPGARPPEKETKPPAAPP